MKAGARSTPFHSPEDLERPTSVKYTSSSQAAGPKIAETNNDRQDLPEIVVDSVQEIAMSIEAACLGASVTVTQDGVVAVNLFKEAPEQASASREGITVPLPYDVIFMNCQMPHMDGYEATKIIRDEERRHRIHTLIIVLTAHEI
ncbi:LOW QUALITY PROTEIN: hypothetical protein U9M48_018503 [Paspalum notatum var. saurae]|uniref:Response regulatory domain-containing protein n=1 Tax=Paspalum notatum var. saurae TaxID=547442 RepID=A0AAQ3TA54_PASNO